MNTNEQRVRECAHQIWIAEGKPEGQAHRHWETACKLTEMWGGGTFRPSAPVSNDEEIAPTHSVHAVESAPSPAPAISLIDTGPIEIPPQVKKASKPAKAKNPKTTV